MDRRVGFLALRVEARRRVGRDHVGQYTAVFWRLVGHCRRCRREDDAQPGRPEPWCHGLPPVRLGRVARPIASSYSGDTKVAIVFGPKSVFGGSSGATDPSPEPDPGPIAGFLWLDLRILVLYPSEPVS